MDIQGCDRKILRAFYTQYVAVLLIIITFTIGAFQRGSSAVSELPQVEGVVADMAPIGEFMVREAFVDDGALKPDNSQLEALASLARNHDVVLQISLFIPRLSYEPDSASLRRALRRINSLEQFFIAQEVGASSLQFKVNSSNPESAKAFTVLVIPEQGAAQHVF